MIIFRIALPARRAQFPAPAPQRTGTASVEGVAVSLGAGANKPIDGLDLELTNTTPLQSSVPSCGPLHPHLCYSATSRASSVHGKLRK